MAETSYAPCGDLSLAYQVFGDGPVDLVYAGSFVSHIELAWTLPEYEAFMEQLGDVLSRPRVRQGRQGRGRAVGPGPASSKSSALPHLADHIPGARFLEVDGVDHAPWFTEPDTILTNIEEILTGSHAAPPQSHRALRTVLFTDMVASTQHAAATGDERWRRCCTALVRSPPNSRNDSAARWSRAPATATSPASMARRRPSARRGVAR